MVEGFRRGPGRFLASCRVDRATFVAAALHAVDGPGGGGDDGLAPARARIVQILQEHADELLPHADDPRPQAVAGAADDEVDPASSLVSTARDTALAVVIDELVAVFRRTSLHAQGLRGRLLSCATSIALQNDYDDVSPPGFSVLVTTLLGCIGGVGGGPGAGNASASAAQDTSLVRERRTACLCLLEVEEARPGLLLPKLGHLFAFARAEQTYACEAYACLFASVLHSAVVLHASGTASSVATGLLETDHEALSTPLSGPACKRLPAPAGGSLSSDAQVPCFQALGPSCWGYRRLFG